MTLGAGIAIAAPSATFIVTVGVIVIKKISNGKGMLIENALLRIEKAIEEIFNLIRDDGTEVAILPRLQKVEIFQENCPLKGKGARQKE